ncbi:MAG: hypothetical protein LBK05_02090 [Treponema sp.]|jgi:hypothetical protein|nr:hypothetical protein [Treponema sp.]
MSKTVFAVLGGLLLFVVSCGMEDYLYLNPVDEGGVRLDAFNTTATVSLPNFSTSEYYYFTHFSLFYRIYVSDANIIATYPYSSSDLYAINSSLSSDFSALSYYTSSTTTVTTNLGSQFSSRRYYALELENRDIENILSSSSLGRQITLDFTPGRAPVLGVSTSSATPPDFYTLRRTGGEGNFRPVPSDRLFFNTQDLNSSANATALINNDVADKSSAVAPRRTYASIYIVTTGRDTNFTPLYSRPTHVGIFSLPDTAAGQ